jgi:hypothetical protein
MRSRDIPPPFTSPGAELLGSTSFNHKLRHERYSFAVARFCKLSQISLPIPFTLFRVGEPSTLMSETVKPTRKVWFFPYAITAKGLRPSAQRLSPSYNRFSSIPLSRQLAKRLGFVCRSITRQCNGSETREWKSGSRQYQLTFNRDPLPYGCG